MPGATALELTVLPGRFAVCRLPPGSAVASLTRGPLSAVVQTPRETSLVVAEDHVPPGRAGRRAMRVERGFRALEVAGPLDFALVGVLASLTAALADAAVSVFALSTFDTDYLLVRDADLGRAVEALRAAGHRVAE